MFTLIRIPPMIDSLMNEFQQFFNDYQWLHFRSLLLSLIITPFRQTTKGMSRALSFGAHQTKHNEFLIDCTHLLNKVLHFYALLLVHYLKKKNCPITCVIDDTSTMKRGKKMEGAFKFFDHVSQKYIWGQQLVCMVICYRGFTIPYGIELYLPRTNDSKLPVRKKTHIAATMLETFMPDEGQTVYVVADTFYACAEIIQVCRKRRFIFISALKTNRIIYIDGKRQSINTFIRRTIRKAKHQKRITIGNSTYAVLCRNGSLKSGGAVKLVGTRNLSHCTVKVLFATDPALPFETIVDSYRLRWSIEVFFKEEKQHLGLKTNQHRLLEANMSSALLSCIAYNLMIHVFLEQQRESKINITTRIAQQFNVQMMQTSIRNMVTMDSIQNIIEQLHGKSKNKIMNTINKYLIAA